MAIGNVMLFWFAKLHERGVFKGTSVLELGPSNVTASEGVCADFLRRIHVQGRDTALTTKDVYALLGITHYESIDLGDGSATHRHDLNEPLSLGRQFDLVAEFGTLEHIFNIGLCLKTMHDHLAVGGCMLHVLPSRGDFNHGFYNIHSTFYRDLAEANDYEIVDLTYVPDHQQQNMTMSNEQNLQHRDPPRLLDISKRDATSRELEFARESVARHYRRLPRRVAKKVYRLFRPAEAAHVTYGGAPLLAGRASHPTNPNITPAGARVRRFLGEDVEVYDYIFAVLRKRRDAPFKYPQQGAYRLPVS